LDVLERGLAIHLRGMIGSAGVLTRPELGAPRHGTNVLLWDTTSCRTAPPLTQSLTHPTLTTGVRYLFALAKVANEFVQLKTRGSAWGSHLLLRPEMAPATVVTIERNPGFQTFCSEFPGKPEKCVSAAWVGQSGLLHEAHPTATVLGVPYPSLYHTPPASAAWYGMTEPFQRSAESLPVHYRYALHDEV
jgi:hypothetical protein